MTFFLILILLYLLGVCFFRFLLPLGLAFWARRLTSRMNGTQETSRRSTWRSSRQDGDVSLQQTEGSASKQKFFQKDDGEYVDFEEIK